MNKDIKFLNIEIRTWYSLTYLEDHIGLLPSVSFRPEYVWFPLHFYVALIPKSSGQLAEIIAYVIPQE